MADIIYDREKSGARSVDDVREDRLAEPDPAIELIELMFFAYRDFTSDPDEILRTDGFGRAHHRVLHFVHRNPGIRVADLLDILKITKQSLGRVLRQLIDDGYVIQRTGTADRRERQLFATTIGDELAERLSTPQRERVSRAALSLAPERLAAARAFLIGLIDEGERDKVVARIVKSRAKKPGNGAR